LANAFSKRLLLSFKTERNGGSMNQSAPHPPPALQKAETKRGGLRKWIPRCCNLLLWLLLCAMSGTGLLIAYRLPPGSRGGHGLSALGMTRHEWGDLHQWISFAFLALIVVHMLLHWRWFWQIAGKKRAWPLLAGTLAGVTLLFTLFLLPVKRAENQRGADTHEHGNQAKPTDERSESRGGKRFRGGREE